MFLQLRNTKGIIYLDGAAEGLLPEIVLERLKLFNTSEQNPLSSINHRIIKLMGRKFRSVYFFNTLENGISTIFDHFKLDESFLALVDQGIPDSVIIEPYAKKIQLLVPSEEGNIDLSQIPSRIEEKQMLVLLNQIDPLRGTERNIQDLEKGLTIQAEADNKEIFIIVEGSLAFGLGLPACSCDLYLLSFQAIFGLPGYACFCSDKLHSLITRISNEQKPLQGQMATQLPSLSLHIFAEFSNYLNELRDGLIPDINHPESSVSDMVQYFLDNFCGGIGWRICFFSKERGLIFLEGPDDQCQNISLQLKDYGVIHSFGTLSEMKYSKLTEKNLNLEKKLLRFSIQWYNSVEEIQKLCTLLKLLIRR